MEISEQAQQDQRDAAAQGAILMASQHPMVQAMLNACACEVCANSMAEGAADAAAMIGRGMTREQAAATLVEMVPPTMVVGAWATLFCFAMSDPSEPLNIPDTL